MWGVCGCSKVVDSSWLTVSDGGLIVIDNSLEWTIKRDTCACFDVYGIGVYLMSIWITYCDLEGGYSKLREKKRERETEIWLNEIFELERDKYT